MGDRLHACKPSWYVASHPGQLSLAISPWVGAMSTSECWDVNRHTCDALASYPWCKLVSGWGLMKRRSAPLYGPYGSGRTLRFTFRLLKEEEEEPYLTCVRYTAGKLQTLDVLLRRMKAETHRVLIFTQMTKMLNVLESFLSFHGHRYLRLDGTTKVLCDSVWFIIIIIYFILHQ